MKPALNQLIAKREARSKGYAWDYIDRCTGNAETCPNPKCAVCAERKAFDKTNKRES